MNVGSLVNKLLFLVALIILYGFSFNIARGQVVMPDQTIPRGTSSNAVVFPGSGCVYNWTNSNPGIGLPASGTGNIASFKGVNTGTTPIAATITATPANSGFAYVGSSDQQSVSVIDVATNAIVNTINVASFPLGISVSPNGNRVYVTKTNVSSALAIDAVTNTVIADIPLPNVSPYGIVVSPDGNRVYVAGMNGAGPDGSGPIPKTLGRVVVINAITNTVMTAITVDVGPLGICISPDGSRVYVSNQGSNTVSVINTATNAVIATIPVNSNPKGITISHDGKRVYVTGDQPTGVISVINTASNAVASILPVGGEPEGIVIGNDDSRLYIANGVAETITVVDLQNNLVLTTIPLSPASSYPWSIGITPDGKEVFAIGEFGSAAISVINTATNTITNNIPIGAGAMAFGNFISSGPGCNNSPITFKITVTATATPSLPPAPKFTYPTPDNYTANTPVTPIGPTTLGGPVPATIFGSVSTFAGKGTQSGYNDATGGAALFTSLWGIGMDASGNLIVADGPRIRKVSPTAVVTMLAGGNPNGVSDGTGSAAGFGQTAGLVVLSSGDMIVGDLASKTLRQVTAGGTVTTIAGNGINNFDPVSLASGASGDLFEVDQTSDIIRDFTGGGSISAIYAGIQGNVGSNNGNVAQSTYNQPADIKFDQAGNLFVADENNNMIREISAGGIVTTVAGQITPGLVEGPDATALFNKPDALAVDPVNNIYVADWKGVVIRMINANGYVVSVAGDNARKISVDGIGPTANFNQVAGLVYSNGVLYAADKTSIRQILVTGYSIDKSLPNGLVFDSATGTISGTPTVISPATQYTIIGYNTGGSYAFTITLGVAPPPPPVITYPTPEVYTRNKAIVPLVPNTSAGGAPSSTATSAAYTIDKPLPLGLILDPTTGIISGTPAVISLPTDYTITAHNDGGTGTFTINITVVAPILNNAVITFNPLPLKTYGDADFDPGATSDNTGEPIVYDSDDPTVATIVNGQIHITGAGTANITATQPGDNNYDAAYPVVQPFTVKPFPLTITVKDQTRYFGEPNFPFTYSYSPFAYNEDVSYLLTPPVASTLATETSAPGQYVINISGATSVNYTITQVSGTLTVLQTLPTVIIPNAFTPNGDGINDLWNIKSIEAYPKCMVSVYSRYGTLIYQSKGYPRSWDGTSNGTPVPTGTYYYIINLNEDNSKPLTGYIAVIR